MLLKSKLFVLYSLYSACSANPIKACKFPENEDLVPVYEEGVNAGWAMSPDEACIPGKYCPYACPPGQLMNQWNPAATKYQYPTSMDGGLYCNSDGSTSKPFGDRSLCVDGEGTVSVVNKASKDCAFCQTVLPGNEAMLIPTNVESGDEQTLAVPGPEYYAGTAAHYYVNPPGVSTEDGCVWGTTDEELGNWAPYVAGMNTDTNGNTFIKIGVNPKHVDDFNGKKPKYGLRIVCDNPKDCNGLECELNPKNGYNKAQGPSSGSSLGAEYCIVTAKNHAKAKIEVFDV
ncbi:hypothetical protein CANMA_004066 [Candida margitis]|uniref:uncharacterized protein n=1 Tax=Candida margitis TaxID=1775924 RepID=UPI0022273034|nr:uncharacterized protein CANMA_004066 [Candida margitis]KAI5959966.1 hypothetical protein CANMA_004066 [Candida margitis]